MAFQSVNPATTKDPVKLTSLKVGESVTGFPISFMESQRYPGTYSILMQDQVGDKFYVNTAGNVKYIITDGKMPLGVLTQITRQEDRFSKKASKMGSHFDVAIDRTTILEGVFGNEANIGISRDGEGGDDQQDGEAASFNNLGGAPAQSDLRAASTKAAVERASVKAQAKSLTASIQRK